MHELALADAVITSALAAAEEARLATISKIEIRIGELQRIDRQTFEFALREILPRSEPRLANTEFALEIVPARFRCRGCARVFTLADTGGPRGEDAAEAIHFVPELAHAFLECPGCHGPDFEVVQGRGVAIEAIEGD